MGSFERRWRARSRRHWAILIACLAIVGVGVWIAPGEPAAPGVVVRSASSREAAEHVPVAGADTTGALPPASLPTPTPTGGEQVEVCGIGWVALDAEGNPVPAPEDRMHEVEAGVGQLISSLATSDDPFARAGALWLQALEPDISGVNPGGQRRTDCTGEGCADSTRARSAAFLEALARMAATTRDPRVYAMAFRACHGRAMGACALLNAMRWAQLDVDNGDPWLYLLDEPGMRQDPAQIDEALYHIGSATRVDMHYFAVSRAIVEHATAVTTAATNEAALQAAHLLVTMAIGGAAALPLPALQNLSRACQGPALDDANRRQRCDAAAASMADRTDTVLYASIGAAMGRRLGWSEARVDAVRSLSSALVESLPVDAQAPALQSCGAVVKTLQRVAREGVVGETGYAREWIVASGRTLAQYAAQEPERRRRSAEAFKAAASAAGIAASAAGDTAVSSSASAPDR